MQNWFEIKKLPNNIYAILEPHHFQEVISYLIIGSHTALLLDTGAGIGNITEPVRSIWNGEIIAINSHTHFDHIGDNHRFGHVLVFNHPHAIARLQRGYTAAELAPHTEPKLFAPGYFAKFNSTAYTIPPCNPLPIQNDHTIDLGGRKISVIHTPGHSPDSIVLLDETTGSLFTGDTYYPGPLYAHYKGNFYGESNISDYVNSMAKLAALKNVKTVHPGHNIPMVEFTAIKNAAQALQYLYSGKATNRKILTDLTIASLPSRGQKVDGYIVPSPLYMYEFDNLGVKIIAE